MLEWLAKTDPETVQRVAEQYVAQGQDDAAARVLALRTPPAPEALAALQLAKIQLSEGNLEKAADNYLKAYLITPATVNIEHLETIVQAQRLEEFMNVLTEDRLKKLGYNNDAEKIVLRLLNEESTRDHGLSVPETAVEGTTSSQVRPSEFPTQRNLGQCCRP